VVARRTVWLGWGRERLAIDVPLAARVVAPPPPPPSRALTSLLAEALASPIGAAPLGGRVARGARVTVIVSDATRDEPRAALLEAVRAAIGVDVELTVAIANGTHRPGPIEALGLPEWARRRVVNHDAWDDGAFEDVGVTARGTRVRFPHWLRRADMVVATGRIRPHYFAGYGAGAKAVFPGLGHHQDIRANHRLKAEPGVGLGRVEGNPCRDDLEEAAALLGRESFLLDVVLDDEGGAQAAVAGDVRLAFRAGVEACRPLCEAGVPRADIVVVSERLPVAGSLYQASKLLAPAAACLRPGGVVVLAAECPDGTGPLETVNEGIFRLGLRPLFAGEPLIYLVSSLPEDVVATTYGRFAPSVESVLARHAGDLLVLPSAGSLLPQVLP
jgi:nickel-dependent lactate racemase